MYKIYSSVLNARIRKYLEQNQLLADEQNGFRANKSCIDHVYSLHSIIKNKINNNKSVFATFIDFQKAFDCVDRFMLQEKLQLKGISGKIFNSIRAMYTNTISRILLGQYMTDWFHTLNGVRQGDTLAPTLFAIFINDLIEELNLLKKGVDINGENVVALLYADDLVIMSESEKDLQDMLHMVNKWCIKWSMQINLEKSKALHFRRKRQKRSTFQFLIGDKK